MKTLIIYSSQTGFTQRYAEWIADELKAEILSIKKAIKKDDSYFKNYDAIIYGGWVSVEKINRAEWFTSRIESWKEKKLAIFGVGASPAFYSGVNKLLEKTLTDDQKKYAKAFYCQGGLDYDKMSLGSKMLMKTFAAMLKSKKSKNEDEKAMIEAISESHDFSNPKYIEPIVAFMKK